jgi:methyl-accepting chemotaxis protein
MRIMLPVVIAALASLVLATTGLISYAALKDKAAADAFLKVNHAAESLLHAAGSMATERALTAAALNGAAPAAAKQRDDISKRREAADKALRQGIAELSDVPEMAAARKSVTAIEEAARDFVSFRARVDASLARPAGERAPDVLKEFAPTITGLIEKISVAHSTLETLAPPPSAELAIHRRRRNPGPRRRRRARQAIRAAHRRGRRLPRRRQGRLSGHGCRRPLPRQAGEGIAFAT